MSTRAKTAVNVNTGKTKFVHLRLRVALEERSRGHQSWQVSFSGECKCVSSRVKSSSFPDNQVHSLGRMRMYSKLLGSSSITFSDMLCAIQMFEGGARGEVIASPKSREIFYQGIWTHSLKITAMH